MLLFPPFAEELNKSRRMIALQARSFADAGFAVFVVDLFGTGDSAGDFAEARWEKWRADMLCVAEYLRENGVAHLVVWGLRSGALLALDVLGELALPVERILLWQPVIRGEQMMTQFLRLRLAAELTKGDGKSAVTTQDLRRGLAHGDALEIAGYSLAPELVTAIDALDLTELAQPGIAPMDWYEITNTPDRPLMPASRAVIEKWKTKEIVVEARSVVGEPFWNTLEIEVAPLLIAASTRCLLETSV